MRSVVDFSLDYRTRELDVDGREGYAVVGMSRGVRKQLQKSTGWRASGVVDYFLS